MRRLRLTPVQFLALAGFGVALGVRLWGLGFGTHVPLARPDEEIFLMSGYSYNTNLIEHHPSFGSVVAKLRTDNNDIPPFVSLRGLGQGHPKSDRDSGTPTDFGSMIS